MKTKLNKTASKKVKSSEKSYTPTNRAVFVRLTPEMFKQLDKAVLEANQDPRNKWTKVTRSSVLRAAVELGLPGFMAQISAPAEPESPPNHAE
jgi:hypothetical protein